MIQPFYTANHRTPIPKLLPLYHRSGSEPVSHLRHVLSLLHCMHNYTTPTPFVLCYTPITLSGLKTQLYKGDSTVVVEDSRAGTTVNTLLTLTLVKTTEIVCSRAEQDGIKAENCICFVCIKSTRCKVLPYGKKYWIILKRDLKHHQQT